MPLFQVKMTNPNNNDQQKSLNVLAGNAEKAVQMTQKSLIHSKQEGLSLEEIKLLGYVDLHE